MRLLASAGEERHMTPRPGTVHLVGGGHDEGAVVTLLIDFVA